MKIMNEHELAQALGLSYWTIRNLRVQKGLPHFRTAGRIFYRWDSVMQWIEQEEKATGKKN